MVLLLEATVTEEITGLVLSQVILNSSAAVLLFPLESVNVPPATFTVIAPS
tara:strand:- start:120 stop:272 length:153 start_codon:yes stop_codon:yes gene_type:complete